MIGDMRNSVDANDGQKGCQKKPRDIYIHQTFVRLISLLIKDRSSIHFFLQIDVCLFAVIRQILHRSPEDNERFLWYTAPCCAYEWES